MLLFHCCSNEFCKPRYCQFFSTDRFNIQNYMYGGKPDGQTKTLRRNTLNLTRILAFSVILFMQTEFHYVSKLVYILVVLYVVCVFFMFLNFVRT